ncbi:MAG: heavy-metal-associated domain-containing protein [Herminiimonas sp.]|nr:heavy-metal-associated domain-containing protein [Herminiimonas sp.]
MYELEVQGMTCGGCANSVRRTIQAVDSGATVDVDLASKKVRVGTGATLEQVTTAVTGAGFPVTASATV